MTSLLHAVHNQTNGLFFAVGSALRQFPGKPYASARFVGTQALAQVAELRQQQTLLKTHIQGEVALASSECTHQLESAQYTWRQKALMMEGQAQSESVTVAKLQAHSSQVDSCSPRWGEEKRGATWVS